MIKKNYTITKEESTDLYFYADYNYYRELSKGRKMLIVSDSKLFEHYPDAFNGIDYILLPQGEDNKDFNAVNTLIEKFHNSGIDRNSLIIAFGGGLISDIVGFTANIYMRGVRFGFVPTTLLAQTDASIGGKNGINYDNQKNYIGGFAQPEFIISDSKVLTTLDENEFRSGLGEVFKYALISENNLYDYLVSNWLLISKRDTITIEKVIKYCAEIKSKIVKEDALDKSTRHILNFGHSFGHAIDIVDKIPHGLAVIKGMAIALDLSRKYTNADHYLIDSIKKQMIGFGFDISYSLNENHYKLLRYDKKKDNDSLKFIFFEEYGKMSIRKIKVDELIKAIS